jgi:hypothetical protein
VVSLDLHTRLGDVRLFTIIAMLGAPLEVTAANLAIETFLPADEQSASRLRDLAKPLVPAAGPAPRTRTRATRRHLMSSPRVRGCVHRRE